MLVLLYLFIILLTVSSNPVHENIANDESLVYSGDLGFIRGYVSHTRNTGLPFLQFLGIPYAQSPTADKRFMPSELKTGPLTQDGTPFNATTFGASCPQSVGGEENCLFLNIATPNAKVVNKDAPFPVIVCIHGAAFVRGNGNKFGGQLLLRKNLIVVSFNYRLGVFGYFGLNTDTAPGNAALYDALTVLQWVQTYIHHFGGNQNLVTIAGQSSGSASVTHLLLSPLSRGLFHRAIALSGTCLNDWGTTGSPRKGSLRIAQLTNCYNSTLENSANANLAEISACMKSVTQKQLLQAQNNYQVEQRKSGSHGFNSMNPSITFQNLKSIPTLLPDFPVNILKRQEQMNVPLLIGATKQDGEFALGLAYIYFLVENGLQNNATFLSHHFIPRLITSVGYNPGDETSIDSFAKTYLGNNRSSGNFTLMLPGLTDMSTVLFFKAASLKMAQLHSQLNSSFLYSFDFKGTHTQHNSLLPFGGGVAHADDLIYVFPVQNFEFNVAEAEVSNTLIDYWDNFARSGHPGTSEESGVMWPEFNIDQKYLIINENITIDNDYQGKWIDASIDVIF